MPIHTSSIVTDASDIGWGALIVQEPTMEVCQPILGPLSQEHHINIKECMAAIHAIKIYNLKDTKLHLYTDSNTFIWYAKKGAGDPHT